MEIDYYVDAASKIFVPNEPSQQEEAETVATSILVIPTIIITSPNQVRWSEMYHLGEEGRPKQA